MRKPLWLLAIVFLGSLVAACSSKAVLNQVQHHVLLQCPPCPTLAPLAQYTLPSEVPFNSTANEYIGGIVTGPDGNLWVTEYDAGKIAKVTEGGSVTEYSIPDAGAGPAIIAVGPDNNLWFTDYNMPIIRRITTAGVITDFPLPAPLSAAPPDLQGITAGPDGNIWFLHGGANVVGVMSTSGSLLATYNIPTANPVIGYVGMATFIVTGPDNNLWFNEETGNKIGRITTSGVITEFPLPTPSAVPKNLVVGADGALWFPEINVGQLGRITTSGAITEYPAVINPAVEKLRRMTATPDGSLWICQAEIAPPWNSQIAKFDLTGTETNLWAFPSGEPRAITVGPDGSPWFTDEANALVIRL